MYDVLRLVTSFYCTLCTIGRALWMSNEKSIHYSNLVKYSSPLTYWEVVSITGLLVLISWFWYRSDIS